MEKYTAEDLIGIQEASALTRLAIQTIYQKSSAGTIPVIRSAGRKKLLFSRAQLIKWMTGGGDAKNKV